MESASFLIVVNLEDVMPSIEQIKNRSSEILSSPPSFLDSSDEEKNNDKRSKGKTLDELFDNKIIEKTKKNEKIESVNFIQRMISFWNSFKKEKTEAVSPAKENKKASSIIDFIPILDVPTNLDPNLLNLKLSKSTEPTTKLSDQEIFDGLSLMDDKTMHKVMMIVLAAQDDLTRDSAALSLDDMERFQKMQTLQQKVLKEIKLALISDEKIKGYFKSAQDFAVAVGILSTLALFVGIELPLPQIANAATATISSIGNSYFSLRADEDKAKLTAVDHDTKVRKRNMENTSARLEICSQSNVDKQFSKLLKGMIQIANMINS